MHAFVVISRHKIEHTGFAMYVAMVASKEAAINAVAAKFHPGGDLEINGLPLQEATISALGLQPGEVRRL